MNLYIYVIDGSQGLIDNPVDWVDSLFTIGDILVTSVEDMANKVAGRLRGRKMQNLFIGGHGAPGYQSIGAGTNWDSSGDRSLQLGSNGDLLGAAATFMPTLAPRFTSSAVCTLGGCQVAGDSSGENLLLKLSQVLNISVQAGTVNQRPLFPGMEGQVIRFTRGNPRTRRVFNNSWWGSPGGGGIN